MNSTVILEQLKQELEKVSEELENFDKLYSSNDPLSESYKEYLTNEIFKLNTKIILLGA